MGQTVELVAADGHCFAAYITGAPDCPRALVLCHDTGGLNGYIRRMADSSAAFGYRVIAPALFDRAARGIELRATPLECQRGALLAAHIAPHAQLADIAASLQFLGTARAGVLGFGWGATAVWYAAARLPHLHAAVGFYGAGIALARQEKPLCPTQLHFAELDRFISLGDVEAIGHAQPLVEIEIYPNADHFFACEESEAFDMAATETARDNMQAFLHHHV